MATCTSLKINILALLLVFLSSSLSAQTTITYPQSGQSFDKHHAYPLALLRLAFEKIDEPLELKPSENFMTQGRAIKELEVGRNIDLMWTMTNEEREAKALPIRIPMYKGLIGWRVFLMNAKEANEQPYSLQDLRALKVVQGHDWPDTDILRANLFNIHSSPNFESLFKMISLARADLFPRSIIEVWDELETRTAQGISLERHTIISYPTASYFFTARSNEALAKQVEKGLLIAIEDGSFDRLFTNYFETFIERVNLPSRTHHALKNPFLSKETPLDDERLWFRGK